MAILKLGELVAGIRGTIGGTIYSANKSGPFARGWSRGSNPQTEAQTGQRAVLSSHASEWRDLGQGDRDDWDTYAAAEPQELTNSLGEAYYASGWNWYCRINNHLHSAAEPRRDTFPELERPAVPTVDSLLVLTPIISDAHVRIHYPWEEFLGFNMVANLTFASSTALVWKSRGYLLVYCSHDDTFFNNQRIGDEVLAVFGDPTLGSKAFAYVQRQDEDGQRSSVRTITTTVIPG